MPLKAVIADDEALAREELDYLLNSIGGVEVVAQATNGIEAVEQVRSLSPDILFLDVQMPGLDGFAVMKRLLSSDFKKARLPEIVFATAFDRYAVRAFEVNAVDYLLKPFDKARLKKTIEKAQDRRSKITEAGRESETQSGGVPTINDASQSTEARLHSLMHLLEQQASQLNASASAARPSGKIVVRAAQRLLLVDQKDICFASIEDGVIEIATQTAEGDSNCRTLEELMELLDPETFWRVHRSHIVNIHHIREVIPWFKSSYQLRMDDKKNTGIPVSRTQTKRLRELFNL